LNSAFKSSDFLLVFIIDVQSLLDQFILGHANARVLNGNRGVGLVGNDFDAEIWVALQSCLGLRLTHSRSYPSEALANSSLLNTYLIVGVEGVDDEAPQLLNVIEGESLGHCQYKSTRSDTIAI
jgi:hypothetical protein